MRMITLLKANLKSQKGSMMGLFLLLLLVSLSLATVLAVWNHSSRYVTGEMERMGFGEITAWVSGLETPSLLTEEITSLDEVDSVGVQKIIFSEYEIGEMKSDSEGQLIVYDPQQYPYKIFKENLSGYQSGNVDIEPGKIYVSPSLCSMFGAEIGDRITFPIARSGKDVSFVIEGFYEDPFMGSSMIGMKGFLICEQDYEKIAGIISSAGIDGLARTGYMLHIFQSADSIQNMAQLNILLNENTSLKSFSEFTHSRAAIAGFMLTLQNVFTGLFFAFVVILLLASMVVIGHSIGSAIEQDYRAMGILKTVGYTNLKLRGLQIMQYLIGTVGGMAVGFLLSIPASALVSRMMVPVTGLLIPSGLPLGLCFMSFLCVFLLLLCFIWLKTRKIAKISPVRAITQTQEGIFIRGRVQPSLYRKGLGFRLALRQVYTGRRRYAGAFLVAVLLVFFASVLGRVNAWLGLDGQGLMDAFNPADLHIAAQPMGRTDIGDVENTIREYTEITGRYMLAMPGVSVNGMDYTANVITEPERFHLLEGRTCDDPDEVVLTEFVAADLEVSIGDTVVVAGNMGSGEYTVSGIYQCANDMGANIGMSREGYDRIGGDMPQMWCYHYFLRNPSLQAVIMSNLQKAYGGDVYLHENSWPGLAGILSAMRFLMIFLYGMVIFFVLVVTLLTAGKLLRAEQRDMGIYKAMGFSVRMLRTSFTARFGIVTLAGSVVGAVVSAIFTDSLVDKLMRMEGISNFSSNPEMAVVLFPVFAVVFLFIGFGWMASARIKTVSLSVLMLEE